MSQAPPFQSESIALIIDNSASATAALTEARETAQKIRLMTGSEQLKLFMLGNSNPISPTTLKQARPPGVNQQEQPCSLIAPIMENLVREEQKHSVIIIGNGEIFDLDDWTNDPQIDGWLLVRTGDQSLKGQTCKISEVTLDQIPWDDIETFLSYFTRFASTPPPEATIHDYVPDAHKWRVDNSGYPLIFVEPLGVYVHLFPVTKPQFEKFITSGSQPGYGDDWYAELLALNPRVSYCSSDLRARDGVFMTAVMPEEASAFGRWLGRGHQLLSAEEWTICYNWFSKQPAPSPPHDLEKSLSRDALAIWGIVETQWLDHRREANLQQVSLMTEGILEWVIERPGRYCGLGEPALSKLQRKTTDAVWPLGRLKNLGFRLCAR